MSIVNDIATLLSGKATMEEKLTILESQTRARMLNLLPFKQDGTRYQEVPEALEYVVQNVTMARYVRIGNEGLSTYSQDGLQLTFNDDDFIPYLGEINGYSEVAPIDAGAPKRGQVIAIY
jgi:hypothetical protein